MSLELNRQFEASFEEVEDMPELVISGEFDFDNDIQQPDNVIPLFEHRRQTDVQELDQAAFLEGARKAASQKRGEAAVRRNVIPSPLELSSDDSFTPEQERLILEHWYRVEGIAGKIADRFGRDPEEAEEAVSDGYLGLVAALREYDDKKLAQSGVTSGNYFAKYISGYILHGMRERYGRNGNRIEREKPSTMLGVAHALSEPLFESADSPLPAEAVIASPGDEEAVIIESLCLRDEMLSIFESKKERDREIFFRYFVLDQTCEEVGEAVGLGGNRCGQIVSEMSQGTSWELKGKSRNKGSFRPRPHKA